MNRSPARLNPLRLSARRSSGPPGRFRGGLFRSIWRDALALLLSLTDRRVGARARWIAALALLYALSPIDLIPDGIPVLGVTDDLLIVPAVLAFAARSLPAPVLMQARGRVARLPGLWPYALGGVLLGALLYALAHLLSRL